MSLRMPPALQRQKYSAARSFYLTILVISAFAIYSLVTNRRHPQDSADTSRLIYRRADLTIGNSGSYGAAGQLVPRDEACRLVHNARDQCAFVRANCPDEEAGLFSYLQLYYCKLHKAQPVAFIILILWLGLLFSTIGIAASDFFCINLSTIASILGMSESMAGVTFLAFGNGSPDVFSTFAAMKTHSGSLAVGELIGAAGFITAVVAGSMALVRPFKVARKSFVRDVGFFIVAAGLSMVFLADGHLHLWECAVMVGFYFFYVVFVVIWHWYLRRRSRRRELENAARGHFDVPGSEEAENEPYHDDDEEDAAPNSSRAPTRTVSATDFDNLERAGSPFLRSMDEEIDADDETRDRYLAEISSNMRVSRPKPGERRNTMNPIRPSLVGALEFRAVLSSLQKSRNIQTIPINLRRYSDDPTFTAAQQHNNPSTSSHPEIDLIDVDAHNVASDVSLRPSADVERSGPNRIRAVSANDAVGLRLDTNHLHRPPRINFLGATPPRDEGLRPPGAPAADGVRQRSPSPPARDFLVPQAADEFGYLSTSPAPMSPLQHRRSGDLLAPPGDEFLGIGTSRESQSSLEQDNAIASKDSSQMNGTPVAPKIQIPRASGSHSSRASSPLSPFPAYHDEPDFVSRSRANSIRLPPPSIGTESTFHQDFYHEHEPKPMRWWPYKVLPTPQVLVSTLLPTLYHWKDKNIWEKLLGIVAAPSVLLLAITLPIVEVNKDDDTDVPETLDPDSGLLSPDHTRPRRGSTLAILPPDSPSMGVADSVVALDSSNMHRYGNRGIGSPAINITEPENGDATKTLQNSGRQQSNAVAQTPETSQAPPSSPKEWNRWLVATQIFTAPFFIVLLFWANTDPELSIYNLFLPCLYTLIGSLLAFAILLLTTSPDRAPKHRYLLCFLGFIVSIAWISTIANEVVGVLKAFGVILGISDAILGLTVFAVGNSLGDLVADITVARLGYPVMALSACFGGPMLNILLGIGLSGLYMTIQKGEKSHEKHPGRPIKFKPYQIEVGGTLLISGITLLVTLAGLLVVVPLRDFSLHTATTISDSEATSPGTDGVPNPADPSITKVHSTTLNSSTTPHSPPSKTAKLQITLRVRSHLSTTYASTLMHRSPWLAHELERCHSNAQNNTILFVNADPNIFTHTLRFLRHHTYPLCYHESTIFNHALYAALLDQARFFCIGPLQCWIESQRYFYAIRIKRLAR
ncbi:solute carrier family 24 (sodium/potassium/calcium exchanger), member 6, partial [Lecanoromycetidae sp. Uapishka_2]